MKFALFENHFKSCIGAAEGDSLGTEAQGGLPFTSPGTLEARSQHQAGPQGPTCRSGTKSSGVLIPTTRQVETPGVCPPHSPPPQVESGFQKST